MTPLEEAFRRLHSAYGPQHWWPADGPFEVMVGAVLVQHTAWRNVERAIAGLKREQLLRPEPLAECDTERLAELVRPAGTPRVKAGRVQALARFVAENYQGSLETLFHGVHNPERLAELRRELLAINGVGPETADAILLYAGSAPTFVVDAYARRVFARHGWGDARASYDRVKRWCESQLPRDASTYNEMHALLVRVGREHCHSRAPSCDGCPLQSMLDSGVG